MLERLMRHVRVPLLVCLLGASAALAAEAPGPTATASSKNVVATLVAERDGIEPGQPLWIGLHLKMAPTWHTYWRNPGDAGLPTRIRWRLPEGFTAGEIQWPRPDTFAAPPLMSYGYAHEVLLLSEVRAPAALAPGEVRLGARIDWLECQEACLPGKGEVELKLPVATGPAAPLPGWKKAFAQARASLPRAATELRADAFTHEKGLTLAVRGLTVPREAYFFPAKGDVLQHAAAQPLAATARGFRLDLTRAPNTQVPTHLDGVLVADGQAFAVTAPIQPGAPPPASASSSPGAGAGLAVALASAFLGGLILNLMPCVLPVLSLKVMGFVRHGAESRRGPVRHALAFAAGVLVFFWLLAGALLALRAGGQQIGWGFQLQSSGFVAVSSGVFLLVALNLFGVFEVGQSLTAAGNLEPRSPGLGSSFGSGALATVVATPCTAPFMGSALGFTLGQPGWATLVVFTSLGLGMAAPYVVLASSPRLLRALPRPGRWMETLKQSMGFPMLATVVFLAWVLGRQAGVDALTMLLGGLLLIAAGAWVYGRGALPDAPPRRRRASALAAGALVVVGFTLGLTQAQAAPSPTPTAAPTVGDRQTWSEERLAELRAAGTPVLVDFTADWCLTCQVNERVALSHPSVRERFGREGLVVLRADWTRRDERITRALLAHGRQGVPLYVLYGRDGADAPYLLPEVLTSGVVLRALDQVLSRTQPTTTEVES
jgi:thiol:disulfide interchange protein DsbD